MTKVTKINVPIGEAKIMTLSGRHRTLGERMKWKLPFLFPGINHMPLILNIYRFIELQKLSQNRKQPKTLIIPKNLSERERIARIIYSCSGLITGKTLSWMVPEWIFSRRSEEQFKSYHTQLTLLWTFLTALQGTRQEEETIADSLKAQMYRWWQVNHNDLRDDPLTDEDPTGWERFRTQGQIEKSTPYYSHPILTRLGGKLQALYREKFHTDLKTETWDRNAKGIPQDRHKAIFFFLLEAFYENIARPMEQKRIDFYFFNNVTRTRGVARSLPEDIETGYALYTFDSQSGGMTFVGDVVRKRRTTVSYNISSPSSLPPSPSSSRSEGEEDGLFTFRCKRIRKRKDDDRHSKGGGGKKRQRGGGIEVPSRGGIGVDGEPIASTSGVSRKKGKGKGKKSTTTRRRSSSSDSS